jgi:hypothetical protein
VAQDAVESAKAHIMRELESGFAGLVRITAGLGEVQPARTEEWGHFEVLSHVVGWHLRAAGRLRAIAAGTEPGPAGDADRLNEQFVSERRNLAWPELQAQLLSSYQALRSAAEAVPESQFWRGKPGEEDSLAYFLAAVNGPDHYREHYPDLGEAGE